MYTVACLLAILVYDDNAQASLIEEALPEARQVTQKSGQHD